MILLLPHSRFLLQILTDRVNNIETPVELNFYWIEFDDVRYHIQAAKKDPNLILVSVALPPPPGQTVFDGGLPSGADEALQAAYGDVIDALNPPNEGFNLTMKVNLSKLPSTEDKRQSLLVKIASIREVLLGAPLRAILKSFASRSVGPEMNRLVAIVHRPNECFFVLPQMQRVTVIFPICFRDSIDNIYAASFLHEFVEARSAAALNTSMPCSWSPTPPPELKEAPPEALLMVNAGFVTFVVFARHVTAKKLDRVVWGLSTFHAFVSYHVKCSEGFIHTRMRRSVESMIAALDRAKPVMEEGNNTPAHISFQCMGLKDVLNLDKEPGPVHGVRGVHDPTKPYFLPSSY